MGRSKRKSKKSRRMPKRKKKVPTLFIVVVVAAALITIFLFSSVRQPTMGDSGTAGTGEPSTEKNNCVDLQIDIDSVKEATSYTRGTLVKPAVQGLKFLILDLTVTNKGDSSKDFSGYKLRLTADVNSYGPVSFSRIDKITLLDNSAIDYICSENRLASISRLELGAGESETGCKIFQVPEDSAAKSLSVYKLERLKCVIRL